MIKNLGYYLRRPGNYLSVAFYDILFRVFFIILALKLLLFTYIAKLGVESFFSSLGIILAISSWSLLIRNNVFKFSYLYVINFLCSLLFLIHALYFKYFDDFASLFLMNQAHQLGSVLDIIINLIDKEILLVVDLIPLPFLIFKFKKINNYTDRETFKAFLFLLILSVFFTVVTPLMSDTKPPDKLLNYIYDRYEFVSYMGIFSYQIVDIVNYSLTSIQKAHISTSEISLVKDFLKREHEEKVVKNNLTGIGKGLNLIVIQIESLQNFVIGRKLKGKDITPNLNRLANEGIYFNNIYDQTGPGNTSDATLLANCSLYPSRRGAVAFLYPQNSFDSLPVVLRENGYVTAVMEAYKKNYWNMKIFDKALGFQYQYYEDNYIMTDRIGGFLIALSDKSFFSQSTEKIKILPSPFYVVLRTLSTHAPFAHITTDIDNFPLSNLEGEIIGYYIRAMHYVDSAIGEFLLKLHEHNLASNTIVVVYGDHRARLPMSELKRIGIYNLNENKKIPLIIYLPNKNQRHENDTIGGLIDIAPTVCNILGVDISDRFFLGRDLANSRKSFVIFRDGSYICRDNSIDKTYAQNQLMISDLILEKDMITLIKNRGIHY